MQTQKLQQKWDHIRQCNGITMRLIAGLPEDQLDSQPIPGMRSPKELVVHLYDDIFRALTQSVLRGEFLYDAKGEKARATAARLRSREDVLRFARDAWNEADRNVQQITDAQLQALVKTPFGRDLPGGAMIGILNDEFFHHRGQLFAFSRALGVAPPMVFDFANNEPAFQPKSPAATS